MIKKLKKLWASITKGYLPDDVLVLTKEVRPSKKYKKVKRLKSR